VAASGKVLSYVDASKVPPDITVPANIKQINDYSLDPTKQFWFKDLGGSGHTFTDIVFTKRGYISKIFISCTTVSASKDVYAAFTGTDNFLIDVENLPAGVYTYNLDYNPPLYVIPGQTLVIAAFPALVATEFLSFSVHGYYIE
jgi:hypothetical protein